MERLARHAHAFHRFAHHPLCAAYAGEVLRFGNVRMCRGCTLALLGGVAGAIAGSLAAAASLPLAVVVAALAGSGICLAGAALGKRVSKLVSRFLPALLLAGAAAWGASRLDPVGVGVAAVAVALAAVSVQMHSKRGPWREPCKTCAEGLVGEKVCSGFRAQLRRERAVMRLSARWIAEATRPRSEGEG